MSNAPNYTPTVGFATEESNSVAGRSTIRTVAIDTELANISSSINALNTNIKLLQRDDGKLKDFVVEPYALSEQTRALIATAGSTPKGEWATSTDYKIGDLVQRNAIAYLAQTNHNSGLTFFASFWIAISGDGTAQTWAEVATNSAASALASANSATTSESIATTKAAEASSSELSALNSAIDAANAAASVIGLSPVSLSAYMLGFLANNNVNGAIGDLGLSESTGSSLVGTISPDGTTDKKLSDLAVYIAAKGAAMVAWFDSLAPSIYKTVAQMFELEEVNALRFVPYSKWAAIKDYTSADDMSAYLANAMSCGARSIYIPYGLWNVSGTMTPSSQLTTIRGDGMATYLQSTVNNLPIISLSAGLSGTVIKDLKLTRNVAAIAGGDGIYCGDVTVGKTQFSNLYIQNQWKGLYLGCCDYGYVENVEVHACYSDGIFIQNSTTYTACQWSFNHILSTTNNGRGLFVQTRAGVSQMTLGTIENFNTYANSGLGMAFVGTIGVPIQGIRINSCFVGNDGNHGIYLDTYGSQHQISNVFAELTGAGSTGIGLATARSNVGGGVYITTNNTEVMLTNVHSNGNSYSGITSGASNTSLVNCRCTNNGIGAGAPALDRKGFRHLGGVANVVGGRFGNTSGSTQTNGVYAADGQNISIIGANFTTTGATAPILAGLNQTYITQFGNIPYASAIATQIPSGGVLVGAGATGGVPASGVINVSAGILKNNVAYTNP